MATLEITGLRKTFGGVVALAGVDMTIRSEEILGVIGPNGSGKTTLFNTVCGVYRPTSGSHPLERRRHCRQARLCDRSSWPGAHVPAGDVLSGAYRARECADRD